MLGVQASQRLGWLGLEVGEDKWLVGPVGGLGTEPVFTAHTCYLPEGCVPGLRLTFLSPTFENIIRMKHKLKQGSAVSLLPAGTELPTMAFHLTLTSSPPARAHLTKGTVRLREAELTSIITQRSQSKPCAKGAWPAAFPVTSLTRSTLLLPLSASLGVFFYPYLRTHHMLGGCRTYSHCHWYPHLSWPHAWFKGQRGKVGLGLSLRSSA